MRTIWKFAILAAALTAAMIFSLGLGAGDCSYPELYNLLTGADDQSLRDIFYHIRLPRLLGAAAAGMLLGMAGALVQLIFRNPLASPHVLGSVNASALGAVLVMAAGVTSAGGILLGSTAGALSVLLLIALVRKQSAWSAALLLIGIALNAFTASAMSGVLLAAGERLEGVIFWLLGGCWRLEWNSALWLMGTAAAVLLTSSLLRRELNMLYLGEDAARHAGVPAKAVLAAAVIASALATAAVVGNCGVIGFVGLLIPHIARRIFGGEFGKLVWASAGCGALLMVLSDLAARMMMAPMEIPVGILTSLLGAPFFLILIWRRSCNREL